MSYGHDNPPPGFAKCTRPWPHEGPCAHPPDTTDVDTWRNAAQTLAADNARLCAIALAADKLAAAGKALVTFGYTSRHARERYERALQDYETARQGQ